MTQTKKWYTSKTIWINVLGVLAAVLLLATKELQLSEPIISIVLFVWGSMNIVVRFLTDGKVEI